MSDYTPALSPADRRIVIVGGPMAGKSTLARQLRAAGYPTFCGDPRSVVRRPEDDVTYVPEGLAWSQASSYVAGTWLVMPGPWVLEGHIMARALRKYMAQGLPAPADRVLVIRGAHPAAYVTSAQGSMAAAVATVWRQIAPALTNVTEYLSLDAGPDWSPLDVLRELGL